MLISMGYYILSRRHNYAQKERKKESPCLS